MLNNNFQSYVRHNSIHDSYQRAATLHAVNYYTVEDNFAYNVFGHTIFVGAWCVARAPALLRTNPLHSLAEDGVERFNIIKHNLVVLTKPCKYLLQLMCYAGRA